MKQAQLRAVVVLAVFGVLLTGCATTIATVQALAAEERARDDMEASKARYKMCLDQNPQTLANCESARLAYDADLRAYSATSTGFGPDRTVIIRQQ